MSTRPQLGPYPLVIDGDMSASITSKPTIVSKLSMIMYSATWSGTSPVGTVSIEASEDYLEDPSGAVKNPGNWVELALSSVPAISGNTGAGIIDILSTSAYAIRFVYNRTSGTGLLQVTVSGKVA